MPRRARSRASWFLAFAGFALLVILHEAGHFSAAKAVGMRVERFSLFFQPTLLRKKVGETEYAIGAIPAGGYVKISGMNPDESLPDEVRTRAYYSQPVWKRIVVIAAGPFVNLVIAFVVLLIFWGGIGAPQPTTQVGSLINGYPAQGVLKKGDHILSVDGQRGNQEKFSKAISAHKCAQQPPTNRCVAQTAAVLKVRRNGQIVTVSIKPK